MAIIANTYLTYSAEGEREDLTDIITNISPYDNPILSRLRGVKATGITHDYQTDALMPVDTSNATIEGDDTSFPAVTPTVRLSNTCQIMSKALIVSGTQETISKAGRKSELGYQLSMRSRELGNDMEYGILNNTAVVSGNATTARQFIGIAGSITTNTTAKASADIVQTDIDNAMSDVWIEGGKPKIIVCHAWNKRQIAGFTTGVTKNLNAADKRLVHSVDVYEPPIGGVVTVVPSHFISTSTVNVLDPELWAVAYLRRTFVKKLSATGDAMKRLMLVEFTIEARQEKGNAELTGTSTS